MNKYKNLFLRQSYLDAYDEYAKSLEKSKSIVWDYVVLTASNEAQAEAYRMQIDYRLENGKLPSATHYAVVPDPDGKRVGSGGATLAVMKYIYEREGTFTGKKIMVIHSGGDSKRIPQYSACGKLFSPVPRMLPDGRRSTLFDEFVIGMTGVPARISDGMLVCSGDVLLLFNPLQIDFYSKGAAALSIKENVNTGKNHGVFLGDENGNVSSFLHKQSVETLDKAEAIDINGNVDIDTGAIIFDSNILNDLYTLINTKEGFNEYVNEKVRLSFYADFLYPLATDSTLEDFYKETPEGEFSPELKKCRTEIWKILSKYNMKLLKFSPASFIHFGTTSELLELMTTKMSSFSFLDWSSNVNTNSTSNNFASSNSYISQKAFVGDGSYIEDSYIHKGTVVGRNCVISGVTLNGEEIPDGTVLHGLKLKNGKFVVRMYGIKDNPKDKKLFGKPIDNPLWSSKIYPVCESIEEAVKKTLSGESDDVMMSLEESFSMADVKEILSWSNKLDDKIKIETLLQMIKERSHIENIKTVFNNGISKRAISMLMENIEHLDDTDIYDFGKKIRILCALTMLSKGEQKEKFYMNFFDVIRNAITESSDIKVEYNPDIKIKKNEVITHLPVRVNFGGGWSDTPPYCLENGGTVLNAAIKLNGIYPIETVIRKIDENKIILASEDNGSYCEFDNIKPLQSCNVPSDPFALHKAALITAGIIPVEGMYSIEDITERLGGGIYLSTRVYNIPRGSGLGTSSILAGACMKGIYEFLGIEISQNELYQRVMCMEQLMSTGGGWQDQVGGLSGGFKMLTSKAGLSQKIQCDLINISEQTIEDLNKRYAIIYTGQRRLARNLLREVVSKYISSNPDTVEALYEIQRLAVLMKFELEKGNIDGFAKLLNKHWEQSKRIDSGCTNTCIDQIFASIEDLIVGKMICGAGGGGFLQVVLKENVSIDTLRERLHIVFADSGVDVWECEFC